MEVENRMSAPPGPESGESEKQYQIRMIRLKLNGGIDLDWGELAGWLRMGCAGEHLRRMAYGVRLVDEAEASGGSSAGIHPEVAVSAPGVQEMRDLRNEAARNYRETDRERAIREQIGRSIAALKPIHIHHGVSHISRGGGTMVAPLADPHYGRECTVRGLDGEILNRYDPGVFERRMDEMMGYIVGDLEKSGADRMVIPMLGDGIDGMLRVSQLTQLQYGIVDSCIRYSEFMAQWIAAVTELACVPVTVINVCGNHDEIRPLNSKRGDFAKENMGRITGWYLSARLRGQQGLEIVEAGDKHFREIEGFGVLFVHGDGETKGAPAARDYGLLYNRRIDYVVRGHLHKYGIETIGTSRGGAPVEEICCPSICGIDDYAVSLKKSAPAGAISFLIEPGAGKTVTYQHIFSEAAGGEAVG